MTQTEFRDRLRTRIRDKTIIVGTTTIISEIVPTGKPIVASYIRVVIVGATVWGTVKIIGYDSENNAQDETLTFTTNDEEISTKRFLRISKIECSGFTGGTIEVRVYSKDFEDSELDEVISQALQHYAQCRPKLIIATNITIDDNYTIPTDKLWIRNIWTISNRQVFWEQRGQGVKIIGVEPTTVTETLNYVNDGVSDNKYNVEYASVPTIEDIVGREAILLLGAEAYCDRMKAQEPDRFVGIAMALPDIERLQINSLFEQNYETKIKQFEKMLMG
ncbi:MAG: hypothetical protein AB1567_07015 [bacterium]